MRSRQRGATFIGMVVIIAILGFALYAAMRLTPLYFEYMEVVRAMEQTAKEHRAMRPIRRSCAPRSIDAGPSRTSRASSRRT